jgi:hypothetical protein
MTLSPSRCNRIRIRHGSDHRPHCEGRTTAGATPRRRPTTPPSQHRRRRHRAGGAFGRRPKRPQATPPAGATEVLRVQAAATPLLCARPSNCTAARPPPVGPDGLSRAGPGNKNDDPQRRPSFAVGYAPQSSSKSLACLLIAVSSHPCSPRLLASAPQNSPGPAVAGCGGVRRAPCGAPRYRRRAAPRQPPARKRA